MKFVNFVAPTGIGDDMMRADTITEITWFRMLYAATGFTLLVTSYLAFVLIPAVRIDTDPFAAPESAATGLWVSVSLHLVVVAILTKAILRRRREGRKDNALLVSACVMLIILGLFLLDAAFAFLGHPDLHESAVLLFVGVGFDLTAGVLTFSTRFAK